jgi:hypothetical protein
LKIRDLLYGSIVGVGSDYIVIEKDKQRYLVEIMPNTMRKLEKSSTPYGSQID